MTLTCEDCQENFERPGRHGPRPRFCSFRCRGRWSRRTRGEELRTYSRERARRLRAAGLKREYEQAYYQRPEVKERYRLRWRELFGDPHAGLVTPAPYSGHRWLDMARAAVGSPDPEAPWADDKYDEMGEAVLALLEGRDMAEAIIAYRKQEFVARHLTIRADDWRDEGQEQRWFESVMPQEPSAEDVALTRMEVQARIHWGDQPRRFGNHKGRQEPAERRRRDAGWRKHVAA